VVEDPKSKCQEMDQISLIAGSTPWSSYQEKWACFPTNRSKGLFYPMLRVQIKKTLIVHVTKNKKNNYDVQGIIIDILLVISWIHKETDTRKKTLVTHQK